MPLRPARLLILAMALPIFAKPSAQGIDNFFQVNIHVYRGAQPSDDGFKYLANLGVKVVSGKLLRDSTTVRHNSDAVAAIALQLAQKGRQRRQRQA